MKIMRVVKITFYTVCVLLLFLIAAGVMSIRYIELNGRKYDSSARSLTLLSDTDLKDDSNYSFITGFKRLKTLDVSDLDISAEGYRNIVSVVGDDVRVIKKLKITLGDEEYPEDIEELTVTNDMIKEADGLSELFSGFNNLKSLNAQDISSVDKLYEIVQAVKKNTPDVVCSLSTEYKGKKIDSNTEELNLNNVKLKDTDTVRKLVELFPNIKKVKMCDCGISDDDMGKLREDYPGVDFVWMLHFLIYDVPTDCQVFSTLLSEWVANIDDETFAPLFKYCTDMRALDLGHWDNITDISAIRNMKNLEILIISDNTISDVTPLADLKHLKYLDIRQNKITDVTPLTELQELQFLEIGQNHHIKNYELLSKCRALKFLYIERSVVPDAALRSLNAELPEDCEFKMVNTRGHKWYRRIIKMFRRWKKVKVYHDWEHVEYYE